MTSPLCETCDVPHSPPVVAENKCLIACRVRGSRWVDVDRCDDYQVKQRIWPVAKPVKEEEP